MRRVAVILLAAGQGNRAGGAVAKQYRLLAGKSVIALNLQAFSSDAVGAADGLLIQPVIADGGADDFQAARGAFSTLPPVPGGVTRQQSVLAGLEALAPHHPDLVLIHDAARPLLTAALIARAIDAAASSGAALPVMPVVDTIKSMDAQGRVGATIERMHLRIAQTPQAFRFTSILDAHRQAASAGRTDFTDDAALAEWAGLTVTTFEGEAWNMKLTHPDDFAKAEAHLVAQLADIRTGQGFDVHAFAPGDHVMLCGVRITHDRGLSGHSDADAGLHALVDAILGALAEGDIGAHFPPSDMRWKGASSDQFLQHAVARVSARGGMIAHLDVTLICEAPKIGPHRDAMREAIARIARVPLHRVAVKATTSEKLGFTGRGEGIAALACATIRLPWKE